MSKLIKYNSHESMNLGHGSLLMEGDTSELLRAAKREILYGNEHLTITSKDYEGYIGELTINRSNQQDMSLEDMWLCPDPNYRGEIENNFYGELRDFKEATKKISGF